MRIVWWVEFQRVVVGDLLVSQIVCKVWASRGIRVRYIELGSVFGFFGKVLDICEVVIVTDIIFEFRVKVEGEVIWIVVKYEVEMIVLPVLLERLCGTIVLIDGWTMICFCDVFWVQLGKVGRSL